MRTWSEMILDIQAKGLSLVRVAQLTGGTPPALSDIKQGRTSEPKGRLAVELFKLHRELCPELADAEPAEPASE